ncbi:DUF6629 family protein [Kitasatospora sp. NPDC058218]
MCWSAQADLVAGGVVSGIGVLCLVRTHRAGRPESGCRSRPCPSSWARTS